MSILRDLMRGSARRAMTDHNANTWRVFDEDFGNGSDVVAVEASNVAKHVFEGTDQETFMPSDYPTVAPPFSRMWIEYQMPENCISKETGNSRITIPAMAQFITAHEMSPIVEESVQPGWKGVVAGDKFRMRWVTKTWTMTRVHGMIGILQWVVIQSVSDSGQLCAERFAYFDPGAEALLLDAMAKGGGGSSVIVPNLTISFMHCKNVIVRDLAPSFSERHATKKTPRVVWKTLDIEPFRKAARAENGGVDTGIRHALHICRGHFRTYTAEKPLFGRGVGTVWVPSHTRGTIKAGIIEKDYNVKAPR